MAGIGVHKPRLCKVVKGEHGYGFHIHGKKGMIGQRIRQVEEGSAAQLAGLRADDKIIFVNGVNVEGESHQEVVKRIKEKENETEMLVVDEETETYLREKGIPITLELLANGAAENGDGEQKTSTPTETETAAKEIQASTNSDGELRPRLCKLQKGDGGFGFNLHSEKGTPGRFVRSIEPGMPADTAGVKAGDRIIEVNGTNLEYEKHSKLVLAIKESGDSVSLLVVDEKTDKFFKSCEVAPSEKYLSGPLPTPKPPKEEAQKDDILSMDLTMLKEISRSSKKKKLPTSGWQNRRDMFNEM